METTDKIDGITIRFPFSGIFKLQNGKEQFTSDQSKIIKREYISFITSILIPKSETDSIINSKIF